MDDNNIMINDCPERFMCVLWCCIIILCVKVNSPSSIVIHIVMLKYEMYGATLCKICNILFLGLVVLQHDSFLFSLRHSTEYGFHFIFHYFLFLNIQTLYTIQIYSALLHDHKTCLSITFGKLCFSS